MGTDEGQAAKRYGVVAHELAPESRKGLKGELREVKEGRVTFVPFTVAAGKPAPNILLQEDWVQEISELELKTAFCVTRKQASWIDQALAGQIMSELAMTPGEKVKDKHFELFADNVDSGIAEMLWRLLPGPGFVVVPASLASFLTSFDTDDVPVPGHPLAPMVDQLVDRVKRARFCCIPIFGGDHFTLLTLERTGESGANSKTGATNPLGSVDKVRRQQAEKEEFSHIDWPVLETDEGTQWETAYYDSYPNEIQACRKVAMATLGLLFLKKCGIFEEPGPRKNKLFQPPNSLQCGFFALHYIEEAARLWLGERRGTQPLNLPYRVERINAVQDMLMQRSAEAEIKKAKESKKAKY